MVRNNYNPARGYVKTTLSKASLRLCSTALNGCSTVAQWVITAFSICVVVCAQHMKQFRVSNSIVLIHLTEGQSTREKVCLAPVAHHCYHQS